MSISIGWHAGGRGVCALCGAQSADRARITSSDKVGAVLLCPGCATRVLENDAGTFQRVMELLDRR
jgi:hypothetical protein